MKTTKLILFIGCILAMVSSCSDNTERVPYRDVRLVSFGFYAEDNPGVLAKDYVLDSIENPTFTMKLPSEVRKTSLVARFTTSDKAVVKVNGTIQQSGVTANDFTYPVDFVISDGVLNSLYSVTIGKAQDYVWKQIPSFTADSMTSSVLKVNPLSGIPYVLFKQSRPEAANQKASMVTFQDGVWNSLGDASDGQIGSNFDFTFNQAGLPYISYLDYTAPISQMNTVKYFDGTSWKLVGNKGVTTNKASFNTLSFDANHGLMLFSTFDATSGPLLRRELCISTFDGTNWKTNQTMPGRSSDQVAYLEVSKFKNGSVYLGILNAISPNSLSLYKFTNGTWTTLLDKWKDPASTAMNLRDLDLDVDAQGNVYLAFVDNSSDGSTLKQRVIVYSADKGTVSSLGNPIIGASGNLFNFDFAVSPIGTPYFFYRNLNRYPVISYFDEEAQEWTEPYAFASVDADYLSLDFTPDGYAFASYIVNRKLVAFKFAEP